MELVHPEGDRARRRGDPAGRDRPDRRGRAAGAQGHARGALGEGAQRRRGAVRARGACRAGAHHDPARPHRRARSTAAESRCSKLLATRRSLRRDPRRCRAAAARGTRRRLRAGRGRGAASRRLRGRRRSARASCAPRPQRSLQWRSHNRAGVISHRRARQSVRCYTARASCSCWDRPSGSTRSSPIWAPAASARSSSPRTSGSTRRSRSRSRTGRRGDFDDLLQEPRLLAALDHPNIVGIVTAERVDGAFFIVMEYVKGESLEAVLDREKSPRRPARAQLRRADPEGRRARARGADPAPRPAARERARSRRAAS